MNLLIIGAGRMGMRHAHSALEVSVLDNIYIADIAAQSLENAQNELSGHSNAGKLHFLNVSELGSINADIAIIATTALARLNTCKQVLACSPKYVLIEKPMDQSYSDAVAIADLFDSSNVVTAVNFVNRLFPFYKQLKEDLHNWPQFAGTKNIMFNGGAIGIGVNGIHLIDLMFHLLNANKATLIAGEIEETLIPSGRGTHFADFGGWASVHFFNKEDVYLGRASISLSATSSIYGGWDIVGSNARVRVNPFEGERINQLRKEDSNMPVYRYQADYLPAETVHIQIPQQALTKDWIINILEGKNILPTATEALPSHKLLFDWLSLSKTYKDTFPIA